MVKIGRKPKIIHSEDRWGWHSRYIETNSYCYVCLEEWKHIDSFQDGIPNLPFMKMPDKDEIDRFVMSRVRVDKPFEGKMSEALKYMCQIIDTLLGYAGGSTVWEFNGLAPNKRDWVRHVVFLGDKDNNRMYVWGLREIVTSLVFRAICKIHNTIQHLKWWR
jgi:hypothetical protein